MIDVLVETSLPRPGTGARLDSLTRKIVLLEYYDNLMGIVNHEDIHHPEANPFTITGAFSATDIFLNGARHRLYREFALYNVGGRFNLDVTTWMNQPPHQAAMQLEIAKELAEHEQEMHNALTEEERKLRREQQNFKHREGH